MLCISRLTASIDENSILKGVDLTIEPGTVHALMGPNGSGKSSLAAVLMGHPAYQVTGGAVQWQGQDLFTLQPHERSLAGLFLAFQHPYSFPGVKTTSFLREIWRTQHKDTFNESTFRTALNGACALLEIDPLFLERSLNDGFSGGEKKRFELLQMVMLRPSLVILDEIDSGLDIDALKIVAKVVTHMRALQPSISIVLITHYQRLLEQSKPDMVHIMAAGTIVASGGMELVQRLEACGYDAYTA
jgi:Fe-S cluster assembly ATP-binding protein